MCKEHVKAIKQILRNNGRGSIPVLKCMEHSNGTLKATDLTVMVQIDTPMIQDGIWKAEALDYGFKDDTKETEWTIQDFPELPEVNTIQEIKLTGDDMAKIIRAMDFTSKDMTRPALTGVTFKDGNVYGCDGYKLYRNKISQAPHDTLVIPAEAVKILKAVKANKREWSMTIYDDSTVLFKSGGFKLYSKVIDATPPEYDGLIKDRRYERKAAIDLKQIKNWKDRCIFIERGTSAIYLVDKDMKEKIQIEGEVIDYASSIGDRYHTEVVMPLADDRGLRIDLAVMKQYKNKVILKYIDSGYKPVFVEEAK